MDALLPVLCLVIGIALPLTVLVMVVYRGWRQLAVSDSYRMVSHQLGLTVDTRGVSLHGHLGDRRVYIGEVLVGHGLERRTEYRGVVGLELPLGMGLFVRKRTGRRWLRRGSQNKAVKLGDENFDKVFEVFGDDPSCVALLMTTEVRAALRELAARWPDLVVTDHHVRVALKQPESSAAGLTNLVGSLQSVADAILTARREVAPPERLRALVPLWSALAEERGLELDPALPAVSGTIGGRRVQLTIRREDTDYQAEVRVWLVDHQPLGIRLKPQVEPDGYSSVGQDIQVGDPAFDQAFVIKGYNPATVRERLNAGVRSDMLRLADAGTVELDDRLLRVRHLPVGRDEVARALDTALDVVTGLGW